MYFKAYLSSVTNAFSFCFDRIVGDTMVGHGHEINIYTFSVRNGGGGVATENWWISSAKPNERAMITMASIGHHEIEGRVNCGGFL